MRFQGCEQICGVLVGSAVDQPRSTSRYSTIAPATSMPLVVSMPSRPGEAFTSMTTGPSSERSMSTPATPSWSTSAARSAVCCSSGVRSIGLADPSADDEGSDVPSLGLRHEPLDEDVGVELTEGDDDRLGGLESLGEHHAHPL
jgi:hypothetical protein